MLPLSNGPEVLSSASDKTNLFAKNVSLYLYLPVSLSSRTNPKLHNISVTLKLVKKIITNIDLSKA